jgi:hypothetical protein
MDDNKKKKENKKKKNECVELNVVFFNGFHYFPFKAKPLIVNLDFLKLTEIIQYSSQTDEQMYSKI